MKAWYVTPYQDDEYGDIVWADTRGQARYKGSREFDDYSLIGIKATRFPRADGLGEDVLTKRWWIEQGFWVHCDGCSSTISELYDDLVFTHNDFGIYCTPHCRERHRQHTFDYRERRQGDVYREAMLDI